MIQRWLFPLLACVFGWFLFTHLSELETLVHTLSSGRWQWIAVAALLQVIYYYFYTLIYTTSFDTVDVKSSTWTLMPIVFASLFVNATAPAAGAAGVALFVDEAGRRGQSKTRAAMATVLVLVADLGTFVVILLAGMAILWAQQKLFWYEATAALLLLLYIGSMVVMLTIGLWRPVWLHQVLSWIQAVINRVGGWFQHPELLVEEWSNRNAAELTEAAYLIAHNRGKMARTLIVALISHIANLLCLHAVFMAFNQTVGLSALVAGYAMNILFWFVSPTPGGAGVVESLLPVIYVSLGIPASEATVIGLAFRGLIFWIPLFIGFLLLRRLKIFSPTERSLAETGEVRLAALMTGLMGLINLISGITPASFSRMQLLRPLLPIEVSQGGQLVTVLCGFALLLLFRDLWHNKRVAWTFTMVTLLVSIVAHLVKGLDYEEAILAAIVLVYLWTQRYHFQALADPPAFAQGIQALLTAVVFTLAYTWLGLFILDHHFDLEYSLESALNQTFYLFTYTSDATLMPLTSFGRYFERSLYLVAAVTFGYGFWMLLRPLLLRQPASAAARTRAYALIEEYGRNALAHFARFPDKLYWFSPGGSVIAYAVRRQIAIALGDPIGPSEDAAAAIRDFHDFCQRKHLNVAFYRTTPAHLDTYQQSGLNILCIGEEGIVDLTQFNFYSAANQHLQNVILQQTQAGYRAELHFPPLSDRLLAELQSVSDEWLFAMQGRERRFDLGWFDQNYIGNSTVITVQSNQGAVVAFANLVSVAHSQEITIDLLRRRTDVGDEVIDFLLISLLQWAKDEGYATFNLGFSALMGVDVQPEDPTTPLALAYVIDHVGQFYSFRGLHDFKDKFQPQWLPRYLVFPGLEHLPAVGHALESVGAGDNFFFDSATSLLQQQTVVFGKRQAAAQARAQSALALRQRSVSANGSSSSQSLENS